MPLYHLIVVIIEALFLLYLYYTTTFLFCQICIGSGGIHTLCALFKTLTAHNQQRLKFMSGLALYVLFKGFTAPHHTTPKNSKSCLMGCVGCVQ